MAVGVDQLYPSPLRYPGGKRGLANYVKLIFLENDLIGSEYVEPFAGGASVALTLLFEEYASHVHINDLNRSVHTFWRVLLEQPEELCNRVARAKLTMKEWERQRGVQHREDVDDVDLAFSTLFLNRTSRSGIIGGGPIGGYDQRGAWKLDARFNRQALIPRLKRIARFRTRITVTGRDAAEYLREELGPDQDRRAFVYLDPPYYVKGAKRAGLYQNAYTHDDHVEIATLVAALDVPWIVSYDEAPEIAELYSPFQAISYSLNYSAHVKHLGSERMYFAPELRTPGVASPAYVPTEIVDESRLAS